MFVHAVIVWRDEYSDGDVWVEEKYKENLYGIYWYGFILLLGVGLLGVLSKKLFPKAKNT